MDSVVSNYTRSMKEGKIIAEVPQQKHSWFPYDQADQRKIFCDRLRSYGTDFSDRLGDHMETKVLRSAIEIYSIMCSIENNKAPLNVCLEQQSSWRDNARRRQ